MSRGFTLWLFLCCPDTHTHTHTDTRIPTHTHTQAHRQTRSLSQCITYPTQLFMLRRLLLGPGGLELHLHVGEAALGFCCACSGSGRLFLKRCDSFVLAMQRPPKLVRCLQNTVVEEKQSKQQQQHTHRANGKRQQRSAKPVSKSKRCAPARAA